MLCLSRKHGQGLTLRHEVTGELIRVVITKTNSIRAGVGVEADRNWKILRDELIPHPTAADHDAKAE